LLNARGVPGGVEDLSTTKEGPWSVAKCDRL
jgi:hypothetical protein